MALLGKRKSNDPLFTLERELSDLTNRRTALEGKLAVANAALREALVSRAEAALIASNGLPPEFKKFHPLKRCPQRLGGQIRLELSESRRIIAEWTHTPGRWRRSNNFGSLDHGIDLSKGYIARQVL